MFISFSSDKFWVGKKKRLKLDAKNWIWKGGDNTKRGHICSFCTRSKTFKIFKFVDFNGFVSTCKRDMNITVGTID